MRRRLLFTSLIAAGTLVAGSVISRFQRQMRSRIAELARSSAIAETAVGPIEFARKGSGRPALMIHGAGGGFDQGLILGEEMLDGGYDIIAPSRFGYLRSPLPAQADPTTQADAFVALLDSLRVERAVVVGVSAGAPSALATALHHPDRASALILVVPRAYVPGAQVGPETTNPSGAVMRLVFSAADFAYWLAIRLARSAVVRFLGVPPEVERTAPPQERERLTTLMMSILPLSRRQAGLQHDGSTQIVAVALEQIAVPTLIISAADDLMGTQHAARFSAEHIPGAELKIFETGGHLLVNRGGEVRAAIASFLMRHAPSGEGAAA